jgi:hypothetical protein
VKCAIRASFREDEISKMPQLRVWDKEKITLAKAIADKSERCFFAALK